jgi:hypothetical protein
MFGVNKSVAGLSSKTLKTSNLYASDVTLEEDEVLY